VKAVLWKSAANDETTCGTSELTQSEIVMDSNNTKLGVMVTKWVIRSSEPTKTWATIFIKIASNHLFVSN